MTIDLAEAMRYLGAPPTDDALRTEMIPLAEELASRIQPRWTWRIFPASALALPGDTARTMLADCREAALMAVTLGAPFDAWLHREEARDLRRALLLDALGSAYVEAACDDAAAEIAVRFPDSFLTDRFSPGYGDLPLAVQLPLLDRLDAQRRIGLTLTDSLMMLPRKSVSAIIGIAPTPQMARVRGCAHCSLRENCTLRKAGTNCHDR